MWIKKTSKELYKHERLTLIEDTVELSNGDEVTYLKYDIQDSGVLMIAERDDKYLILREYSYPVNEMIWQFPEGWAEHQDLQYAANRELEEEAGISASEFIHLGYVWMDNRRSNAVTHIFHAKNLVSVRARPEAEEIIECHWLTSAEIDQLVKSGSIHHSRSIAAWSMLKASAAF